jgi:hypothetical protein
MIKYIIDKGVDLECSDKDGLRPIDIICMHSTPEIMQYMIDKNGWKPIHY